MGRLGLFVASALVLGTAVLHFEAALGFNEVWIDHRATSERRTLEVNSFQHEHFQGWLALPLGAAIGVAAAGGAWVLSPAPRLRWAGLLAGGLAMLFIGLGPAATVQTVRLVEGGVAGSVWVGPTLLYFAGSLPVLALYLLLLAAAATGAAGLLRPDLLPAGVRGRG